MADRILVDQQASTEAPFVALIDIIPDGTTNTIATYYESIYKSSSWGIHPNGFPYWSDAPVPLLEAARLTTSGGKFYLDYVIPRNFAAVNWGSVDAGLTQTARTAAVTTANLFVGTTLSGPSNIAAKTTASTTAGAGLSSVASTRATTSASSTVGANISVTALRQGTTTTASSANAALSQAVRTVASTLSSSTVGAALSAAVTSTHATTAATTVNAALTQLQATSRAVTVGSSVNAAAGVASAFRTTASSSADAGLTATATSTTKASSYTETFTGTNGAAWPSRWTITTGTGTIQNNAGQLTSIASSYAAGRADYTYMPATTGDSSIVATITQSSAAFVEQYVWVGLNCDPTDTNIYGSSQNELYLQVNYGSSNSSGSINFWQGQTQVSGNVGKTLTPGTPYGIRVLRQTGTVYARLWDATGAEPGTWDFTIPLSSFPNPTPTGVASVTVECGNDGVARTSLVDNVTITY